MPRKRVTAESPVEELRGVGKQLKEKLNAIGIMTIRDLANIDPFDLAEKAGISESKAESLVKEAVKYSGVLFKSAIEVLEERKKMQRLTTSSVLLDDLLGGGIETGAITEFYGQYGSGKTQLGFQLSVNATMPVEKGGLDGEVVFVDTENTFRPERIQMIAKAQGLDPIETLKKIHYARPRTTNQMVTVNELIEEKISEGANIRLIVVDSLMALFRAEFVGRGMLAERQQRLMRYLAELHDLAEKYNIAVYVTNQVQSDPGAFFGNPEKATGGNILAHSSTYRVYLRKSKGNKRIARMIDAPNLPDKEAVFLITDEGIRDDPDLLKRYKKMKDGVESE